MAKVYKWIRINKFISIIGVGLVVSIGIFVVLIVEFVRMLGAL